MTTPKLSVLFTVIPEGFSERSLDGVHEISIPWNSKSIDMLNAAASVKKYLNGHFSSAFGNGYCLPGSCADRMIYHFLLQ